MTGVLSNKGCHDGKSVATVAAVLYHKGTEWGHTECPLGEKVTQADVEVEALCPALRLLGDYVIQTNYSGPVELITGSPTAPGLCLNFSQHAMQHIALKCVQSIDMLLTAHPGINITIQYAKRSPALVGLKRARHLALEAVKGPLPIIQQPPSIHYQRAETKAAAIKAWGQQYWENPRQPQAYNSALITPPEGQVHTILRIASTGIQSKGHTFSHQVSR